MSLNNDEKVKNLLSEGVYEVLLNAVDEGKIDQKKAESIAEQLHKSVVGDFRRQVSSDSFDRTDFREILSGWYQYSAFDFTHEEAVKCLIRALKHPNLGEDLLSSKLYQNDSNFFFSWRLQPDCQRNRRHGEAEGQKGGSLHRGDRGGQEHPLQRHHLLSRVQG